MHDSLASGVGAHKMDGVADLFALCHSNLQYRYFVKKGE